MMVTAGALLGCATPTLPPPESAAREFAAAAERGDAEALYGLMTAEAQREYGREGTRRLVEASRRELGATGAAFAAGDLAVEAGATVRYADGEQAELVVEDGQFRIELADVLPARPSTPEAALAALRVALARRSYAALFRLLSEQTRAAIARDLDAVVEGLADPTALDVQVDGDTATVALAGGHSVRLKREEGIWRVEDFD